MVKVQVREEYMLDRGAVGKAGKARENTTSAVEQYWKFRRCQIAKLNEHAWLHPVWLRDGNTGSDQCYPDRHGWWLLNRQAA